MTVHKSNIFVHKDCVHTLSEITNRYS